MGLPAITTVRRELRDVSSPEKAPTMARYLRDQFAVLGVSAPERRVVQRPWIAAARQASAVELLGFADGCWAEPEREFQYVATDLLRAVPARLEVDSLARIERLITTKPWWDTVDHLAGHVVGSLVRRFPELVTVMDDWIGHDDIWLARTAILHQLYARDAVDAERLYRYAIRRSGDREFFIRKALGWALRQHARVDPVGVRTFVGEHRDELSNLTIREALKHLPPLDG